MRTVLFQPEQEFLQYFLSFLKTLALRAKPDSMHLLIRGDDYPLVRRAVKLAGHSDQMVRTQARAAYLTLLRCAKDGHVLDQVIEVTLEMLLVAFGNMFGFRTCFEQQYLLPICSISSICSPWFGNVLQKEISRIWATQFSWCLILAYESEAARAIGQTLVVTVVCNGTGPRDLNTYLSRDT